MKELTAQALAAFDAEASLWQEEMGAARLTITQLIAAKPDFERQLESAKAESSRQLAAAKETVR